AYLRQFDTPALFGFEATGNYHRPLAYFLHARGFELRLIPTMALARTREAMHNSWDKNDPKDAQVILHMLKTGLSQTWHDPLVSGTNDAQELSKTHHQVTLARTRVWHRLRNHYFPLYFPEIEHFIRSDHSDWLIQLLLRFPTPGSITSLATEDFAAQAWSLVGRKVHKAALLAEIHAAAQHSIALPVPPDGAAVAMLRLVLEEYLMLGRMRESIAQQAEIILASNPDRRRLMTVPGVGPLTALTILAEAGDLRRFAHYRQFLKFCGMSLSTQQSGRFRGISRLSKYGTRGCARRSGWRPRPRCACAKTVCAASSIVTFVLTRWMPICAARGIARSLPSSRVSSMD
ncbi:MAG TPA: IS110 family transposase, partial [Candidatus Acidoferrales bacterium]|nr:IS110 family transposase [Candidatus Acidoferrales bacterium]